MFNSFLSILLLPHTVAPRTSKANPSGCGHDAEQHTYSMGKIKKSRKVSRSSTSEGWSLQAVRGGSVRLDWEPPRVAESPTSSSPESAAGSGAAPSSKSSASSPKPSSLDEAFVITIESCTSRREGVNDSSRTGAPASFDATVDTVVIGTEERISQVTPGTVVTRLRNVPSMEILTGRLGLCDCPMEKKIENSHTCGKNPCIWNTLCGGLLISC